MGLMGDANGNIKRKIIIELTNRCNLNCIHCCINANEYSKDLEKSDILKLFDKIAYWNPDSIVLSGGEPLMRSDIWELLEYLREIYKGYITLCTNGLLINKNNIDILKKCTNQIDISVDGVDEESCKIIRGAGVFDKVIERINLLKENGYEKITLSMIITDKNAALENAFYELNNRLGTKPVIRGLSIIGRGVKNRKQLTDLSEGEVYIQDDFYDSKNKAVLSFGSCKAGKANMFIRHNGDILPCPLLTDDKYKINNINEINCFEKVYDSQVKNPVMNQMVDIIEKCRTCEVQQFCWACPAIIKEYIDNNSLNDYCKKVKKTFFKKVWGEE